MSPPRPDWPATRPSGWLLAHGVELPTGHDLEGTIVHNPFSNLNNAVGYADPARFEGPVALGTDGIGASMLETFRLAYALRRSVDVTATPEVAWRWLETGWASSLPRAMTASPGHTSRWSPGTSRSRHDIRPLRVEVAGSVVWADGRPTRVDAARSGPGLGSRRFAFTHACDGVVSRPACRRSARSRSGCSSVGSPTSGRTRRRIFDLPANRFFDASAGPDLSVRFLGRPAATPLGPASGPHTQLAENIVLAWLAGARIVELKTVQVLDELDDLATVHRHGDGRLQHRVEPGAARSTSRSRST